MRITGTIIVKHDNVEGALRKLKRRNIDTKKLVEIRERQEYTKPSAKKRSKQISAKKRWTKYLSQEKRRIYNKRK